jgi:hypothetical protein
MLKQGKKTFLKGKIFSISLNIKIALTPAAFPDFLANIK